VTYESTVKVDESELFAALARSVGEPNWEPGGDRGHGVLD
jgi:hypothetical protein